MCKNVKGFSGVYMIDELPKSPKTFECGVVNFDISKNIGTHWVCYIKNNKISYVFDSFGEKPPKRLISYLSETTIYYNNERIQNFNEVICGHLCVTVLKMYSSGINFKEILFILNADHSIWRNYVQRSKFG